MNEKTAANVLQQAYGLEAQRLTPMAGYGSTNYRVETTRAQYVLKRYPADFAHRHWVAAENEVCALLSRAFPGQFPQPVSNQYDQWQTEQEDGIWRLLTFLPGTFWAEAKPGLPAAYELGLFLARMHEVLADYRHPAIEGRRIPWDLQHCLDNQPLLASVQDSRRRNLAAYFFQQFALEVAPHLPTLPRQTIHSDANDWNVLVEGQEIRGLIDFGDMNYGPRIHELAIAASYLLLEQADPLAWLEQLVKGFHALRPLETMETDLLYYLIAGRWCTSVVQSSKTQKEQPDNPYISVTEGPAWRMLERWISIHPGLVADRLRACLDQPVRPRTSVDELVNRRQQVLSPSLSLSYQQPLLLEKGAFQYLYDGEGHAVLDAYNNIIQVGHAHPRVVEAAHRQMARLNTNTRYLYPILYDYAEQLLQLFPASLNRVFFVNSGSAASDLAIRLARNFTQRQGVLVLEEGYHGNTALGIAISHYKYAHRGGKGKPDWITEAALPDTYRGLYRDPDSAGSRYAADVLAQLDKAREYPAAFIAEPIVGCGGQVPLAPGYLPALYPELRRRGVLCISDEVQVGFGRLGPLFWGFTMHRVVSDIVILGKPMGNGHPIGAVVTTSEIADAFANGMEFFSSFGGNPVSCAIGQAVLNVLAEEELPGNALRTGNYLRGQLQALGRQYQEIGDVRGEGLFLGVDLVEAGNPDRPATGLAKAVKNALREQHILVSTDGPADNVLKIKPPLCFNQKNADRLVEALAGILHKKKRET
jgi:4-aminobutyrate aminotransferase-like enzyme/Ser/Thr protein kinase RdoA (MazF antagonist)